MRRKVRRRHDILRGLRTMGLLIFKYIALWSVHLHIEINILFVSYRIRWKLIASSSSMNLKRLHPLMYRGNPTRQVLPPSLPRNQKPGLPDHIPKLLLARKLLYALDEILIAVPIRGHDLAQERDRRKTPSFVEGIEGPVRHLAKLQTGEHAAWLQDPVRLPQRGVLVREVADAKGDGVQVDGGVGYHVEMLGVGFDEGES